MCVTVASVSSHLVVRTRRFWKIKEKKIEKKINIDLAIIASQSSERRFMTWELYQVLLEPPLKSLGLSVVTTNLGSYTALGRDISWYAPDTGETDSMGCTKGLEEESCQLAAILTAFVTTKVL